MREIVLFGEDSGHREVVDALVRRVAREYGVEIRTDWRSAKRGHGKVVRELDEYLRDLRRQGGAAPDLIVVATDANCHGLNRRLRELERPSPLAPMIFAVPDPHVERWLLLDGAAFKAALGRGCDAPDSKCTRSHYNKHLIDAILAAGVLPSLGGIEFAGDIVQKMDIDRACRADESFKRFVEELRDRFRRWRP